MTLPLAAVAIVTLGAALLLESLAGSARPALPSTGGAAPPSSLGGLGADTITALAAIILGILGLIGYRTVLFLNISILVLGAGLLLAGGMIVVERLRVAPDEPISGVGGIHMAAGAGALVIGVLGLLGVAPVLLPLIATISIGSSLMLSGAALGARVPRPAVRDR
jgi:hypothetical protein